MTDEAQHYIDLWMEKGQLATFVKKLMYIKFNGADVQL